MATGIEGFSGKPAKRIGGMLPNAQQARQLARQEEGLTHEPGPRGRHGVFKGISELKGLMADLQVRRERQEKHRAERRKNMMALYRGYEIPTKGGGSGIDAHAAEGAQSASAGSAAPVPAAGKGGGFGIDAHAAEGAQSGPAGSAAPAAAAPAPVAGKGGSEGLPTDGFYDMSKELHEVAGAKPKAPAVSPRDAAQWKQPQDQFQGDYGGLDVYKSEGPGGVPEFTGRQTGRDGSAGISISGDTGGADLRSAAAVRADGDLALLRKWYGMDPSERGPMPNSVADAAGVARSAPRPAGIEAVRGPTHAEAWNAQVGQDSNFVRDARMHNRLMRFRPGKDRHAAMSFMVGMDRNATGRRGQDVNFASRGLDRQQRGIEFAGTQDYRQAQLDQGDARLGLDRQRLAQDFELGMHDRARSDAADETGREHERFMADYRAMLDEQAGEKTGKAALSKEYRAALLKDAESVGQGIDSAFDPGNVLDPEGGRAVLQRRAAAHQIAGMLQQRYPGRFTASQIQGAVIGGVADLAPDGANFQDAMAKTLAALGLLGQAQGGSGAGG